MTRSRTSTSIIRSDTGEVVFIYEVDNKELGIQVCDGDHAVVVWVSLAQLEQALEAVGKFKCFSE